MRIARADSAIRRSEQGVGRWGEPVPGRPQARHRPLASGMWSRRSPAIRSGMSAKAEATGSVGSRTGLGPSQQMSGPLGLVTSRVAVA
jgi:hypothetical protein